MSCCRCNGRCWHVGPHTYCPAHGGAESRYRTTAEVNDCSLCSPGGIAVRLSRDEWNLVHYALRHSHPPLDFTDPEYETLENVGLAVRRALGDAQD